MPPPERPRERPPVTDAEYRVVRGPWPRWAMHLSLIKLMAWGASVVGVTILIGLALLAALGLFRNF
ncbi:MAG TPA: hypothetical protein VJS38_16450 [Phenylobacterium sp.]|uniref:hypothetical protein n=1 Tax=Phenylobacterium sp. TaxID=1871053 RepID=UPI002B45CCA7|nr:hypothetical protein [Phenylobacterium sp.]HKR89763.1 hypothetical protein [Phenylobacterium sp.]